MQAAFSDGLLWVGFRQSANGFLFFNYFCLLLFIQALRLAALSLTLSHGREDGWLLGLRVLQGKQVVQVVFYFSDGLLNAHVRQPAL